MSYPIGGTFTLVYGDAKCTLPHDATEEEVREAVEEIGKINIRIERMKMNWPMLGVTANLWHE